MIDLIDFCIFSKILQIAFTDGLLTDTHALMLEMLPHLKIIAEMTILASAQLPHCLEQASWTLWGWEGVIFHQ